MLSKTLFVNQTNQMGPAAISTLTSAHGHKAPLTNLTGPVSLAPHPAWAPDHLGITRVQSLDRMARTFTSRLLVCAAQVTGLTS
ncbi:hypothetical protein DPMN_011721 [Dreissena polymorpha]|uniref:Uncharacterized protein n=1 Tax=Dreissena polymorpha TaxID=45954 RepID=A0A9D4S2Q6_DREPO|nr:hypothetical protein DPMN_011721 [Dreissena polymorpha]